MAVNRLVRHGFLPEREIMTGIGLDRGARIPTRSSTGSARARSAIRFSSTAPGRPMHRRSKKLQALIPIRYLKVVAGTAISGEALAALVGLDTGRLTRRGPSSGDEDAMGGRPRPVVLARLIGHRRYV